MSNPLIELLEIFQQQYEDGEITLEQLQDMSEDAYIDFNQD